MKWPEATVIRRQPGRFTVLIDISRSSRWTRRFPRRASTPEVDPVDERIKLHWTVNAWDVARATGQGTAFLRADLAEQQVAPWRLRSRHTPRDRMPIAVPQPVAGDAPDIDACRFPGPAR